MDNRILASAALIACCTSTVFGAARAQESPTPRSYTDAIVVEEIIVTATRRETSLQQTPASIGILTGEDIIASGVLDIGDYWRMAPSLFFFDKGSVGKRITIRGLTSSAGGISVDASMVSTYLDDTPLMSSRGAFQQSPGFRTVDTDRIEVLRGPQGTLFGASSMGGAVRIITNKADPTRSSRIYEAFASRTAHGSTNFGITAIVNEPLSQDRSAVRLTAYHLDNDGFVDDISLDINNKNSDRTTGLRAGATWLPGDDLEVTGKIQYQDSKAGGFPWVDPVGKPSIGLPVTGDYQSSLLVDDFRKDQTILYSLNSDYASPLGTLTSSTSYFETDTDLLSDWAHEGKNAFGVFLPYNINIAMNRHLFSQELRLASEADSNFDWLVGAFYMDESGNDERSIRTPGLEAICPACTQTLDGEEFIFWDKVNRARTERGIFVDVALAILKRLEVNLGVRWFDMRSGTTIQRVTESAPDGTAPFVFRRLENDGFSGKASIGFRLTDEFMLYALASKGFRQGSSNPPPAPALCGVPEKFGPDELWNYEIGVRTQWLSGRLTINATLYTIDWDDAQLFVLPPCFLSVQINSGGVTNNGSELEFWYRPNDAWEISGGVGLMDATLDKDVPTIGAPAGRRLAMSPDVTANIAITYRFDLTAYKDAFARIDVQHVGDTFSDVVEAGGIVPIVRLPAYTLANLRLGLEKNNWEISLFADNLFDKRAAINCCGIVGEMTINRPRTVGVRALYRN